MSENQVKSPSTGVKVLLVLLSILLCACLLVSLTATALVLDLRLLTSKGSFEKIVTSVLKAPAQQRHLPLTAAMGGLRRSEAGTGSQTSDALVSWVFDALKDQYGDELTITEEQMTIFLEESTVKDFLVDKTASYMSDFVNGTNNTTVTAEEVEQLIEENSALIERAFGVAVTPDIQDTIAGFVKDMEIGEVIQKEVLGNLEDLTIPGYVPLFPQAKPDTGNNAAGGSDAANSALGGAATVSNLMADLRMLSSVPVLVGCIGVCLVLIVALFFTNRMRIPGTFVCTGIPAVIAGILLVIPTSLLQAMPDLFGSGEMAPVAGAIGAAVSVIAPVHYGLLGLGAVLIIAAIVIKCIQSKKTTA